MMKICWNIFLIFSQNDFNNVYGENKEQIVEGENELLHVVEYDIKSPIFGSNSYNAIKNVFEHKNRAVNNLNDTNFATTVHDKGTQDDHAGTGTPNDNAGPDNPDYNLEAAAAGPEDDNADVNTPKDNTGDNTHDYNETETPDDDSTPHYFTGDDNAGVDNPDPDENAGVSDHNAADSTHNDNTVTGTPDADGISHGVTGSTKADVATSSQNAVLNTTNHKEEASTVSYSDISDSNISMSISNTALSSATPKETPKKPLPTKLSEENDWWSKKKRYLRQSRKNTTFVPKKLGNVIFDSDENFDTPFVFSRKKNYNTRRTTAITYNKVIHHVTLSDWWSRRQGSRSKDYWSELL